MYISLLFPPPPYYFNDTLSGRPEITLMIISEKKIKKNLRHSPLDSNVSN